MGEGGVLSPKQRGWNGGVFCQRGETSKSEGKSSANKKERGGACGLG